MDKLTQQTERGGKIYEGLTAMQSAFVEEFVRLGGKPGCATQAALAAGYAGGDSKAARVRASELLKNEKVLEAIKRGTETKLRAGTIYAAEVLLELARNGPPSVRLQAAKELLDRGYGPVMSRNAHVVASSSIEDLLAELDERQGDLIDFSLDAEFEDI